MRQRAAQQRATEVSAGRRRAAGTGTVVVTVTGSQRSRSARARDRCRARAAALPVPSMRLLLLGILILRQCAASNPNEGLLQVEVDRSTGAYTVELAGQPWLQSGALRFFVNGEWHGEVSPTALLPSPPLPTHRTVHSLQRDPAVPVVTGRLKLQSTPSEPINGTDGFGPYSKLTFDWLAISSKGATTGFSTSIRSYLDGRTAVFEQSVPDGAMHTNYKNVSFVDVGRQQATTEPFPFLHFPSFNTTATNSIFATVGRAGYVGWNGTFVYQHYGAGPPISEGLGLSSGPIVIFDGLENAGGDHAVVISPATHFKGATMMRWEEDWVVGLSGEITHVPAGFLHETILVAGEGVTATVDYYGRKMRAAFHTNKLPDPVVDKVGYWTDNGAYYSGPNLGVETAFRPRKKHELVLSIEPGCADTVPFQPKTKHPVLTRPISNPQNPFSTPKILEPSPIVCAHRMCTLLCCATIAQSSCVPIAQSSCLLIPL